MVDEDGDKEGNEKFEKEDDDEDHDEESACLTLSAGVFLSRTSLTTQDESWHREL